MIYQAILKIRGKEIPILYYNYRCHIQHHDDSNLRRIIQLHIQVCEEIGNRENLPVEGDLITLAFECSGDEAFFYDWLNGGTMQDGEIHFIYNEVEVADILRFWDCYCVKIEEYMSVGNAPMMMVGSMSRSFPSGFTACSVLGIGRIERRDGDVVLVAPAEHERDPVVVGVPAEREQAAQHPRVLVAGVVPHCPVSRVHGDDGDVCPTLLEHGAGHRRVVHPLRDRSEVVLELGYPHRRGRRQFGASIHFGTSFR